MHGADSLGNSMSTEGMAWMKNIEAYSWQIHYTNGIARKKVHDIPSYFWF